MGQGGHTTIMDNCDYKELYIKLMNRTENAIRILIQAQQECEELYLKQSEERIPPNEVIPITQDAQP